jgi:hypothetical protein
MSGLKRKQNFVDKSVQGGLVRRIFFHWVAFFFVTALAVLSINTLLGDPASSFATRFNKELGEFVYLGIVFVAIFPAFMLDTIRFSNRFVGPIVRLRRHLVELGTDHKTDDIRFRDNDFWQNVADEFNKVNQVMRQQREEIKSLKQQLGQSLETSEA